MRKSTQFLLWLGLVSVVMLPRLLNLNIFVGPDELYELGQDNQFTLALAAGDLAGTLVGDGKPSVTLMWINTVGITVKWLWLQLSGTDLAFVQVVAPDRPFSLWAERRMYLALVSGLQLLAAWPLLKVVWNKWVATVAVGLMAIEPFFLTFTRMIRGDALLAGFMLLSILGALAFLKTGQQRYNLFSGIMAGLSLLTKLSGGVIVPVVVLIYAAVALSRRPMVTRQPLNWFVGATAIWGLAGLVIFVGLWPAWWFQPIETFNLLTGKMMFHAVEAAETKSGTYFWGAVHPSGPGMWFYPVLALLRLTPWLLVGGLIAAGHWSWRAVHRRSLTHNPTVAAMLFYVAAYWLTITIPGQKIDRFFTPVIPALAVLVALEMVTGIYWLKDRLSAHRRFQTFQDWLMIGSACLVTGYISLYHPLYSTYFNPLSGTPDFWQWALPIGQGEGVDEALNHLSTNSDVTEKTLVCGTNFPRCSPFFAGEILHQEEFRSSRWFAADYALWHIDKLQTDEFPPGVLAYLRRQPPIYVAAYQGLDYTWLYPVPRPSFLTGGAKLEGVATLLGYEPEEEQSLTGLLPGDPLNLHLYWLNEGQAADGRFWWRIVDQKNYVWDEAYAKPLPAFENDAYTDGAVVEGEVSLALPPDIPPGTYYLKSGFANAKGDIGEFTLPARGSSLTVQEGASTNPSPPDHSVNKPITEKLKLRGYDLSTSAYTPGETLWVTLYWQALEEIKENYRVTLQLFDETKQPVAVWSGQPVYGTYPTESWPSGANVRDPWPLPLPLQLSVGQYQLQLDVQSEAGIAESGSINLGIIDIVTRKPGFDIPPMQVKSNQTFGEIATLLGYDLLGDLSADGARIRVTLYWQALQSTAQPFTVNLRLVDPQAGLLIEQESQPAAGTVPTTAWIAGEVIPDRHEIQISTTGSNRANLEIRLKDATGHSIPLSAGDSDVFLISDVQKEVIWRTSPP